MANRSTSGAIGSRFEWPLLTSRLRIQITEYALLRIVPNLAAPDILPDGCACSYRSVSFAVRTLPRMQCTAEL